MLELSGGPANTAAPVSLGRMQRKSGFMRTTTSVALVAFVTAIFSPSIQAMQAGGGPTRVAQASPLTPVEGGPAEAGSPLTQAILDVQRHLGILAEAPIVVPDDREAVSAQDRAQREARAREAERQAARRAAAREALTELRDELRERDTQTRQEFADTEALIREKQLPKVIQDRHRTAVEAFDEQMTALYGDVDAVLAAQEEKAQRAKAQVVLGRLSRFQFERSQQELDPEQLPNSNLQPDETRAPRLTPQAFLESGLFSNPLPRFAQLGGGFDYSQLPGASNPAYLAETDEVVLTDEIEAKAAELGNDPVRIYEWVRNNVHWQPTWGAIQDAAHTLSAQRGNAFDIASLTIALLRASGIPSRYVHGTIDVPADPFRNWAGGFQRIEAAMDFASAGGIPLGSVTSGGQITQVRMEHIWVEAAIDYAPSRGAVNRSADTWVAIDPSFKTVEVLPGLDTATIAGLAPQVLADTFLASASTNDQEGWAAGFDPTILGNAQTQSMQSLEAYVEQNLPDGTVGDILGGRRIVTASVAILPSRLPNRVVTDGARYGALPAALQQRITFAFGRDILGDPINPRTFAWATLNNRQVMLSFRPASQADVDALRALLPDEVDFDVSQLPNSLPAYLINVVPELLADGEVVMSGAPVTLGTDLTFVFTPRFAGRGERPNLYKVPAGSYLAVAVIGGSISTAVADSARARLQSTRAILESGDVAQIGALTRERVLGDIFHVGVLAYYAQYIVLGYMGGLSQGGHHQLAAGIGSFGFEPGVDYLFGIPRRLTGGGVSLNIPIINVLGHDGTPEDRRVYSEQLGAVSSALEHVVPEQMFTTPDSTPEGISASAALTKALAAGQRVYVITPENQSAVLPQIRHDPQTMAEIRTALATGKHVTTHTDSVSVPGWTGAGYVILNPQTGEGAWKIAGGQNGGFLDVYQERSGKISFALFALALLAPVLIASSPILPVILTVLLVISLFNTLINTLIADLSLRENGCPEGMSYLLYGLSAVFFLLPRFIRAQMSSIVMAFYAFMLRGTMPSAARACNP